MRWKHLGNYWRKKASITKQEILDLAKNLKRKNPHADPPHQSQQPFTAEENAVIEQLMKVILRHGLFADHGKTLLARTIQLLERGRQARAKKYLNR